MRLRPLIAWPSLAVLSAFSALACAQQLGRYQGETDDGQGLFFDVEADVDTGQPYVRHFFATAQLQCNKSGMAEFAVFEYSALHAPVTDNRAEFVHFDDFQYAQVAMNFLQPDRVHGRLRITVPRLIGPAPPARVADACGEKHRGFTAHWAGPPTGERR